MRVGGSRLSDDTEVAEKPARAAPCPHVTMATAPASSRMPARNSSCNERFCGAGGTATPLTSARLCGNGRTLMTAPAPWASRERGAPAWVVQPAGRFGGDQGARRRRRVTNRREKLTVERIEG